LPAAVNLLTRATFLHEAGGRPRLDLLVDLGAALFPLGEGPKAVAVLDEALEAARAAGEAALEWRARLERDYVISHLEPDLLSVEEGLRTSERAVQALERLGDHRALARAWRSVTQHRFWLGKIESSLESSERALDYARRVGDRQGEIWTLRIRIMALWTGPTPAAEAARGCEEILAAAENEEVVACALENLGGLRAMQGRSEEARRLVDSSAAIYEELGLTMRRAFSIGIHRTEVHALSGDLAAAEHDLRNAIVLFESIGDKATRALATAWLAGTLYAVGRYSEAERHVEMGEELATVDDYAANSKLRSVQARIMARSGDFEHAKAAAEEAVTIADVTDDLDSRGALWMDKAEVLQLAGDPEGAASSLERAIELLEQKGNIVLAGRARAKLRELHAPAGSSR
jgi:tetratricopeptide (TPR) repeat protein